MFKPIVRWFTGNGAEKAVENGEKSESETPLESETLLESEPKKVTDTDDLRYCNNYSVCVCFPLFISCIYSGIGHKL